MNLLQGVQPVAMHEIGKHIILVSMDSSNTLARQAELKYYIQLFNSGLVYVGSLFAQKEFMSDYVGPVAVAA